jgi:hypothetical protein
MSAENTAEQALTHHVRLILDNDEGLFNMRREIVQAAIENAEEGPVNVNQVADELSELYEQLVGIRDDFGVEQPGLPALEILSTALAFVDWFGIAEDYIAEERES